MFLYRAHSKDGILQCANDEFVQSKTGATSDPRSEMMTQLAQGYDAYMELQGNLAEGTKFYNNLTKILTTYQSNVSDFVFARNTEKDDLMKLVWVQNNSH